MQKALYDIALQNSDRYEDLARQAESTDDGELAEFFLQTLYENNRLAERAKLLLAQRVAE